MLPEKDFQRIVKNITKLCKINGVDEQVIDFEHEIDNCITYEENYNILKDSYNLKDEKDMQEYSKCTTEKYSYERWQQVREDGLSLFDRYVPFCVGIVGSRDSGKTAFSHRLVDRLRKAHRMPIYMYKYPKPELLVKIGYKNLKELRSLEHLHNIILWLDEPQITLKKYDKKNNDILQEILSICRHRNIILVISTADTRWINRALESYIDVWVVKDIDYQMAKQGSRIKYIIKQYASLDPEAFTLEKEEYLLYYRKDEQYQGKFKFALPIYWNESYSKPYAIDIAKESPKEKSAND